MRVEDRPLLRIQHEDTKLPRSTRLTYGDHRKVEQDSYNAKLQTVKRELHLCGLSLQDTIAGDRNLASVETCFRAR